MPGHQARRRPVRKSRGVGLFGRPSTDLERSHHPADAQHPGGVVRHQLQPDGTGHHPADRAGQGSHPAPDPEAVAPDAGHDRIATPGAVLAGPLPQRPGAGVPGDHADLPRGRCQPHRLPGAAGGANAHPHRAVPGLDSDRLLQARRPGGPFGQTLQLDTPGQHPRGGPPQCPVPVDGPGPSRPVDGGHTHPGLRLHLGAAEDDHDPHHRPTAAVQPDHDAVDDAADDSLLFPPVSQRPVPVLDNLQRHRNRHTVFHNRVGPPVPTAPQVGAGSAGPRTPGSARGRGSPRGDGRKWKSE